MVHLLKGCTYLLDDKLKYIIVNLFFENKFDGFELFHKIIVVNFRAYQLRITW